MCLRCTATTLSSLSYDLKTFFAMLKMPKKSSSVVLLLDDSSSSDNGNSPGEPIAAKRPFSRVDVNKRVNSEGVHNNKNNNKAMKPKAIQKGAPRKPLLGQDSSDEDDEELEVMPPTNKRLKSNRSSLESNDGIFSPSSPLKKHKKTMEKSSSGGGGGNENPRLSSTGFSRTDPFYLCVGSSPGSLECQPLAQRVAKRKQQQQGKSKTNDTGNEKIREMSIMPSRLAQIPSVSLSVASSSTSSPRSPFSGLDSSRDKGVQQKSKVATKDLEQSTTKSTGATKTNCCQESDDDSSSLDSFFQSMSRTSQARKEKTMISQAPPAAAASSKITGIELSSDDDDDATARVHKRPMDTSRRQKGWAADTARLKKDWATANTARLKKGWSSSSSSSDEDSSRPIGNRAKNAIARKKNPTRTNQQQQKEAEKAEKRRQREEERAAKQGEKDLAKERRERERKEKKEAEERSKEQRKQAREEQGQARGKFASQEVAVLMEPTLVNHETFQVKETFQEQGYHLHPYLSALSCLAVQWVRRDYTRGGAQEAINMVHARKDGEFEHFNTLAVLFDSPHNFISLIQRNEETDSDNDALGSYGEDDDDYPKLEEWLLGLVAGWRAAWRKTRADRPRIFLLLYQVPKALDKAWISYNRSRGGRGRGPPPPNAEQLHDAILWMLIQFQIEVIHCENTEDVPKELAKITKFLANARYQAQTTELACVQKLKAQVSDMAPSLHRAVDCWIRQLQQVPLVSAEMARCLARSYPTARSLWLAYQDTSLTVEEKQVLVADCFGTRSNQVKVSKWLYRIFTSHNPDELLT